ncbi:MAG TPA: flagellar hook protein FlgE [Bryobacteraceae bacterium]|jgi:flagellar hook protein FlgE|nr:flagellar hook protein FlgE [Bryobacteraceae bacterium]
MISSYSAALSGLEADSGAINVIGNDLANLNTTGYKANEVQFSELIAQHLGVSSSSGQVGLGVSPVSAYANYTQGTLQSTGGATDAAIQGDGFFVVQGQNNQTEYTRDGSFQISSTGELVTAAGDAVQGWSATSGAVNTNGPIGNISVPLGATVPATATTSMQMALNLNSTAATTGSGATFSAPIQVFDSLGQSHTLTATFNKTAANTWSYSLAVPAADLQSGGTTTVSSGTLTFDSNGNLSSPAASADPQVVTVGGLADGAADMSINWNLYNPASGSSTITQLAESSGLGGSVQNGFAAGQISDVSLQNGGLLVANYTNGQTVTVGQLAVASISNPDSLTVAGNNYLQASASTGTPSIGTADSGARGQIIAGARESSTVDIAQEFTNLLTFERSYQANSRVITVSDQLQQDTVGLIQG